MLGRALPTPTSRISYTLRRMKYLRLAIALIVVLLLIQPVAFGQRAGGWSRAALGDAPVFDVHTSVASDGTPVVYVNTDFGVLRRADGDRWQRVPLPSQCSPDGLAYFQPAPTDERFRYVYCTSAYQSFASEDGGQNWRALDATHGRFMVDPAMPTRIYSGVLGACIVHPPDCSDAIDVSLDAGRTWNQVFVDQAVPLAEVASSVRDPTTVLVLSGTSSWNPHGAGIFRSTDSGSTWSRYGVGGYLSGVIAPDDPRFAIASAFNVGTIVSTDAGGTWERVNDSVLLSLTFARSDPETPGLALYARTTPYHPSQIVRSRDRGLTWEPFSEGLPEIYVEELSLTASADGRALYVVGDDGHLYERAIGAPAIDGIGPPSPAPISHR